MTIFYLAYLIDIDKHSVEVGLPAAWIQEDRDIQVAADTAAVAGGEPGDGHHLSKNKHYRAAINIKQLIHQNRFSLKGIKKTWHNRGKTKNIQLMM